MRNWKRASFEVPVVTLILFFLMAVVQTTQANDWETPGMIGQNKEPAHCTLMPYPDTETALVGTRQSSPFHKSLNGRWKFNWVKKPADRPKDFYKLNYDITIGKVPHFSRSSGVT